jgi:phosphoadenosine phosphosulfate reductase
MNLAKSSKDFEDLTTADIVTWALERFSPRVGLACSFQAEESVLIDLMHRVRGADFRLFTLDTGRLNQETYDCMDAIRERYGVEIEVFFPEATGVEKWCGRTG